MTDSIYSAPGPRSDSANAQTPIDGRRYATLGTILTAVPSANVGSVARIIFDRDVEIDELAVYLNATYTNATTYTYRLGIYRDNGSGLPGALARDAGTVSIAQNATAGFKGIALTGGDVVNVSAGEPFWVVCAASHSGTVPTLINYATHQQPYSDYGLISNAWAACFGYAGAPGTALPATYSLPTPPTNPIGVAVYVKVNV
jgi:hypothetical protein